MELIYHVEKRGGPATTIWRIGVIRPLLGWRTSQNDVGNAKDSPSISPIFSIYRPCWTNKLLGFALLTNLHIAGRALLWTVIGLGLVMILIVLRLDAVPIELGWLKPRIERALTPENSGVAVTAERVELRLDKEERTLSLVGVDVQYRAPGEGDRPAAPLLAFPEVELALSIEAFLKRGMIAASDVHARAPSLVVIRNEDGVIDLRLDAEGNGGSSHIDVGAFLERFIHPPGADDRIAFLKNLHISGGRVAFYDRGRSSALTAKNADLTLTRRDGGVEGWLRANVLQGAGVPASVQLTGRFLPDGERLPFSLDIADLMPSDLEALWPLEMPAIPPELRGVRLPVRASIGGEVDLDGNLSPLKVDLQASAGVVDLPDHLAEPLEIDRLDLKATVGSDLTSIEVEQAEIVSRDATLSGAGRLVWREEAPTIALDLDAKNVRIEDFPAFWPPDLGIDAREWVLENLTTGRVIDAEAEIDLRPDDFGPAPLRDDAIGGRFTFEGLSVRYVEEMPPLEAAAGRAVFDADRMAFDVVGGNSTDITVKGGSVTITGMGKPGKLATQLRVLAALEGGVEPTLTLLDYPPLEIAKELDIPPEVTSGRVAADLEVRMPLHDDVTEEEVVVLAEAGLKGLAIQRLPKLDGDVSLDGGVFGLTLDEEAVRLDGSAAVNGIPLDIDIIEPLEEGTATRRIHLAGRLSREQLDAQGLPIDGLDGELGFKAAVTETGTNFWIDLEADLTALGLAPPGLAWRKPAGQEALLRASIAKPIEGPLEVKQFDLSTGDLEAAGSFAFSEDGLQSLSIDQLRLADSDVAIRYEPDGRGGNDLVIEGSRLDLDALLGEEDGEGKGEGSKAFHVILRTDELRTRGIELRNVEADAVHGEGGWRTASLLGTLPSGGKVALELTPEGRDQRLEVRSDDAGALIEALDLGQRIKGGTLFLSTKLLSQDPVIADGRFEITEFVLQDAPLLARMLTLASLTGIGNLLGGEGIKVDHLILPFTNADQNLTISDGLLRGSQLGLTVKGDVHRGDDTIDLAGTIIPVYTLNRLIGQVPVIGRILTGVNGRGAFAATYSLEGALADPTVYVNPLSILTPGLIRDLFGGLVNGTLKAPDVGEANE